MCNLGKLYYATTGELSHLHEAITGLYLTLEDLISLATVILKGSQPPPQHLQLLGTMSLLGSLATPMKQLPVTNLVQPHQTYYH